MNGLFRRSDFNTSFARKSQTGRKVTVLGYGDGQWKLFYLSAAVKRWRLFFVLSFASR